ncbi:MAG: acyl-CoA synthetase (AMP-forming)/AMP-acid ligase [Actinomycetia bacterium]|nr:acyl-CoA synthetase (AMP-forming)/AMP-acid ligase [Actinomycetes bacterium]
MNLASIVEGHPGDSVALVGRGVPTTYGELRDDVARLRGGLVDLGLRPDDRVALLCANNRLFVVAYLAVLGAGCVAVPLNPLSPPAEIDAELQAVQARAAIVGPSAAHTFDHDLEHVLTADDVDHLVRTATPMPVAERRPEDLAALLFTAGTAGAPKAAMLTHGNLHTNIRQAQAVPDDALGPDDVVLGVLPLFHVFGLNVILGVSLFAGATVVLVERFDPTTALDTVRNHRCTIVAGAPPMWSTWAGLPRVDRDAFASVRLALSGAAPLSSSTVSTMYERFGVTLREGYGLTEASPIVTSSAGTAPGSIGRPLPGVSVRLVDEDGDDVPLGDPGELWVQGPNVFAGYWRDPEATATALTADGWLRTGDVAVADADGTLRLVDRIKDLIIVSGFNVFPAEVEAVLQSHRAVADAAVVGVPHPHTGEAVKAFVVVRPGFAVEEDDLVHHCEARLARYKCPAKVLFVPELPVGAAGKVIRRTLRD